MIDETVIVIITSNSLLNVWHLSQVFKIIYDALVETLSKFLKIIYNYQSDRFLKLFMTTIVEVHNWVGVCHHVFVQISYFFQVWRTTFCSTKSGNPWEFPSDSNHAEYQMKYTRNLHTFSIIWEITFIASIFLSHLFMVLRFLRLPSLVRHLKKNKNR